MSTNPSNQRGYVAGQLGADLYADRATASTPADRYANTNSVPDANDINPQTHQPTGYYPASSGDALSGGNNHDVEYDNNGYTPTAAGTDHKVLDATADGDKVIEITDHTGHKELVQLDKNEKTVRHLDIIEKDLQGDLEQQQRWDEELSEFEVELQVRSLCSIHSCYQITCAVLKQRSKQPLHDTDTLTYPTAASH
jgi:hypothetical protein